MPVSTVEFAVQMSGPGCAEKVKQSLNSVGTVNIDIPSGRVVVDSDMPWIEIQEKIEETGRRAVLSGFGEKSAVAIVKDVDDKIKGVVRFSSTPDDAHTSGCVVDGVIDGLTPGQHGLHIHECGDISNGCESLGKHYNPRNTRHGSPDNSIDQRHAGDLGNIEADNGGRAKFRFADKLLTVNEIIGRSIVVTERADDFGLGNAENSLIDGDSGKRLACGIIARSAGIFQNFKKICACDGVTIWDERDKPVAGGNRSSQ
ncbi:copper chaperone for superoxide dismutase [Contarinia nasturtii]|uniref:copper chaperone for superoxide dismutase n=1 Tax=Contarinia nasturtii TaxID=265458 RepID=UPI0012D48989|nr:copper chaperone for superoxide dismutase [Contarinia nasturtii]